MFTLPYRAKYTHTQKSIEVKPQWTAEVESNGKKYEDVSQFNFKMS